MQKKEKDYRVVIDQECNVLDMMVLNFKKMRGHSIEKHLAFGYDLEKFYPELWHAHLVKIKELDLTYTAQMLQKGISQGMFRENLNVEATSILVSNMVPDILKELMKLSMNTAQRVDYVLDVLVHILCSEEGLNYYQSTIHN